MSNLLAWFNPTRWIALGVLVAALIGAYTWHRSSLVEQGRQECRDAFALQDKQAADKQGAQNTQATKEVVVTETLIEVRYKDRIKEVVRYEAPAGTSCIADPDFLRNFNAR
jgi:hypothetical protein